MTKRFLAVVLAVLFAATVSAAEPAADAKPEQPKAEKVEKKAGKAEKAADKVEKQGEKKAQAGKKRAPIKYEGC